MRFVLSVSVSVYVVRYCVEDDVSASKVVIHTVGRKRIFVFHVNAPAEVVQTRSFQLMRRDKSCEPVRRRSWAHDTSTIRKSSAADRMTASLVQRQEAADRQSNGWRRYAKLQSDCSCRYHLSRIV